MGTMEEERDMSGVEVKAKNPNSGEEGCRWETSRPWKGSCRLWSQRMEFKVEGKQS